MVKIGGRSWRIWIGSAEEDPPEELHAPERGVDPALQELAAQEEARVMQLALRANPPRLPVVVRLGPPSEHQAPSVGRAQSSAHGASSGGLSPGSWRDFTAEQLRERALADIDLQHETMDAYTMRVFRAVALLANKNVVLEDRLLRSVVM